MINLSKSTHFLRIEAATKDYITTLTLTLPLISLVSFIQPLASNSLFCRLDPIPDAFSIMPELT